MNEKKFSDILTWIKKNSIIPILFLFGILLLVSGDTFSISNDKGKAESSNEVIIKSYTEELEKEAAEIISRVSGVSNVSIMITLDGSSEMVYAENTSSASAEYLIINSSSGEEPVLIREIYSSIRGIAVVCNGGNDVSVKKTVTELLSCAFGIPGSKIFVAGT